MSDHIISYAPGGQIVRQFHQSNAFVRGLMGPVGSSKSSACVIEVLRRAKEQAPGPDGIRRFRAVVVRNSYPELKTTTLKTWEQWCPLHYGKITFDSPITHKIKTEELDIEVLFMALDRPEDVKKLLSLEVTMAWANEAREIPKAIIDGLTMRVGRYPSRNQGGATWYGVIMDTNPPDDQSWWYNLAEGDVPEGWEFFRQPGGREPNAENLQNLPPNYYKNMLSGKDPDWIKVYVDGEYGFVTEGKPVYPMYRDRIHCAADPLEPLRDIALTVGVDFGLTPSAVIGQKTPSGRWLILDEVTSENCGVTRFGETLSKYLKDQYPDHQVARGWGDPAGAARDGDERTSFELLNSKISFPVKPAPENDLTPRLEVVMAALNRLIDGEPGFVLSPKCKTLRKGFLSGYHYKSVRTGNGETFHEKPAKNNYSHPHDALQYLLLGGGEYDVVLNKVKRQRRVGGDRIARHVDDDPLANA